MADVAEKSKRLSEDDVKNINTIVDRITKIGKYYEDAPDFKNDIEALNRCLKEDDPCFIKIIQCINVKIYNFFIKDMEDIYSQPASELQEDLEAFFGEAVASLNLNEEDSKKMLGTLQEALDKRSEERAKRVSGVKVKRVPKIEGDAAEVAAAIGLEGLAKELTVDRPKPILTDVKKGVSGVTRHMRVINQNEVERVASGADSGGTTLVSDSDVKEALDILKSHESDIGFDQDQSDTLDALRRHVSSPKERKPTMFETIEELESLVGQYTAEKLAASRKLRLAKKALAEANAKLEDSNVNEILKALDNDKLKIDYESLFEGRKY